MGDKIVRAIFPGSFDPITNGHLDVINRGMKLFDELIVAVGKSPLKDQLFTPEQRVEMIAELIKDMPGVSVEGFDGLTVEYARQKKANVILRGLRSLTDVNYEFELGDDQPVCYGYRDDICDDDGAIRLYQLDAGSSGGVAWGRYIESCARKCISPAARTIQETIAKVAKMIRYDG